MSRTNYVAAYKGVRDGENVVVKVFLCDDYESPRTWENVGKIITSPRNGYLTNEAEAYLPGYIENKVGSGEIFEDKEWFAVPMYMYAHGGATISLSPFSCPWDSGQCGWYGVKKEEIKKEFEWKRFRKKEILRYFEQEIKMIDKYLSGEVYGWTVYDHNGNDQDVYFDYWLDLKDIPLMINEESGVLELEEIAL